MAVKEWNDPYTDYPQLRLSERHAFCRACDGKIEPGDAMITMYSRRNRGQHIHFHPECVERMAALVKESDVHTD